MFIFILWLTESLFRIMKNEERLAKASQVKGTFNVYPTVATTNAIQFLDFVVFLPIVFLLYWFVFKGNLRQQNLLIVGASYLFYGWWDWRFLFLILFSTLVDFFVGRQLDTTESKKESYCYGLV